MDKNQILADEGSVFGQILGDNKILVTNSPLYDSYFNSCQKYVTLWIKVHVENMGRERRSVATSTTSSSGSATKRPTGSSVKRA